MNQLDMFSQRMGDRHIGYKGYATLAMLDQLGLACTKNNIPFNRVPAGNHALEIVYWVNSPTTAHCADETGIVDTESGSGIMSWFWFVWLSWDQFLELVQGIHQFKDQAHYDKLLAEYDKPFIEKDDRNREIQMKTLFDAGHFAAVQ